MRGLVRGASGTENLFAQKKDDKKGQTQKKLLETAFMYGGSAQMEDEVGQFIQASKSDGVYRGILYDVIGVQLRGRSVSAYVCACMRVSVLTRVYFYV